MVLGPESMFGAWQADIVSRATYPGYPFFEVSSQGQEAPPVLGGYALPELSRLTASAEQISQNVAQLTERMELAFNEETADNFTRAIENIEGITEEVRLLVAQQSQIASSITANADTALFEIQTAATTARSSFDRIHGILDTRQIDSLVINLNAASQGMRSVMAELADTSGGLTSVLTRADSSLARIDRITAMVESDRGTIGRLLSDSTAARRTENVLTQLDLLLQDLRENPSKYVRLSIF